MTLEEQLTLLRYDLESLRATQEQNWDAVPFLFHPKQWFESPTQYKELFGISGIAGLNVTIVNDGYALADGEDWRPMNSGADWTFTISAGNEYIYLVSNGASSDVVQGAAIPSGTAAGAEYIPLWHVPLSGAKIDRTNIKDLRDARVAVKLDSESAWGDPATKTLQRNDRGEAQVYATPTAYADREKVLAIGKASAAITDIPTAQWKWIAKQNGLPQLGTGVVVEAVEFQVVGTALQARHVTLTVVDGTINVSDLSAWVDIYDIDAAAMVALIESTSLSYIITHVDQINHDDTGGAAASTIHSHANLQGRAADSSSHEHDSTSGAALSTVHEYDWSNQAGFQTRNQGSSIYDLSANLVIDLTNRKLKYGDWALDNVWLLCTTGKGIKVNGTQVLTDQQAGIGAAFAAGTAGAAYGANEQGMLQAAHDKIRLLETALRAHGLVAT